MKQYRVSFKKVNDLCTILKPFRLVKHEWLGKTDYFYNYSLVIDDSKGNYKETVLQKKSLKEVYNWLLENGIDYINQ
jgi:hypothetical protein